MQLNGGEEKKKGEMQFGFAHRERKSPRGDVIVFLFLRAFAFRIVSAIKNYSPRKNRVRHYSRVLEMHSVLNTGYGYRSSLSDPFIHSSCQYTRDSTNSPRVNYTINSTITSTSNMVTL